MRMIEWAKESKSKLVTLREVEVKILDKFGESRNDRSAGEEKKLRRLLISDFYTLHRYRNSENFTELAHNLIERLHDFSYLRILWSYFLRGLKEIRLTFFEQIETPWEKYYQVPSRRVSTKVNPFTIALGWGKYPEESELLPCGESPGVSRFCFGLFEGSMGIGS